MKLLRIVCLMLLMCFLPGCMALGAEPREYVQTESAILPDSSIAPIAESASTELQTASERRAADTGKAESERTEAEDVNTEAEPTYTEVVEVTTEIPAEIKPHSNDEIVVYMTFDDGPNAKNTERILAILEEKGVSATFFTVGWYVDKYPELVKKMHEGGHAIGCHSYTHDYTKAYESAESLTEEIAKWEQAMINALGELPEERLFRFPGGSTACDDSMQEVVGELGYNGYDWNALNNDCLLNRRPEGISEEDYLKQSLETTIAYSLRLKGAPHILLMHETCSQTADLLEWTIDYLRELGCSFGRLDELDESWYY